MKHTTPITPNTHEVKSIGVTPLMDTEAQIADLVCPFPLANLRYEIFADHVRNEDPFRVVASGLYYQIAPPVHHFPKPITWLANSYQSEKNCCVSSSSMVILEINPLLI